MRSNRQDIQQPARAAAPMRAGNCTPPPGWCTPLPASVKVWARGWRRQGPPREVSIQHANAGQPHNHGHRQQACGIMAGEGRGGGGALRRCGEWPCQRHLQSVLHSRRHVFEKCCQVQADGAPAKRVRSEYFRSSCRRRYVLLNLAGSLQGRGQQEGAHSGRRQGSRPVGMQAPR